MFLAILAILTAETYPSPVFDHIGHVGPSSEWAIQIHSHANFNELIYVLRGSIQTRIRGQVITGRPGDALLYPSREPHAERSCGEEPLETIFIGWLGPLPSSPPNEALPLLVNDRTGRIRMLLDWLADCTSSNQGQPSLETNILMSALLYEYHRRAQTPDQVRLEKVREYLRRNLSQHITLADMAHVAGLSKYHFSREFKLLTGQAPMQALRNERVAAARALILSTPLKLHAIARQVGFADEYQLSRVFKRVTGKSPKQIRI